MFGSRDGLYFEIWRYRSYSGELTEKVSKNLSQKTNGLYYLSMKDMTSVSIYVMQRVMKNFWKSIQDYFNRNIARYKKINPYTANVENRVSS
jgi:hypothetical protein